MNSIQAQPSGAANNQTVAAQPAKPLSEQIKLKATEEVIKTLTQRPSAPVPAPAKAPQQFMYEAAWGPFKVRCVSYYETDLRNLDKILMFLDDPDVKSMESYVLRFTSLQCKVVKRLARLWNFLFGDHRWYNESCARKLIKHFAKDANEINKTDNLRAGILKIHDRLADIRHGKGTWAQGIDRSLLEKPKLFQRTVQLLQSMPEMHALKQTAQTIGRIALLIGKLWLSDQVQKKFGQEKVPYLDIKATDLTNILISSLVKI